MNTPAHANPKRPASPRLAALHRDGDRWHVVVARTDASGAGGSVSVVHAGTVPNVDAVNALLREHRVGHVVGVIPAAETICRPAAIPDAPGPAAAAEALALIAEAELP